MATSRGSEPLRTTSYAILGVLAIKPRTAYELAAEMRHCFEFFWPRADTRVYNDAKELAARGLARVSRERVGRRPRTTYAITPAGKRALNRWLAEPPKPVALEFEALVKTFFARLGTREDLLATLAHVLEDSDYMFQIATNVRQAYLDGCAPFQDEYVHTWVFVYDFLTDYFSMLHSWAERTNQTVRSWRTMSPEGKRQTALDRFEAKRPQPVSSGKPVSAAALPGTWQHGRARPRVI